jgi:6,7-dimethyl-8-ribityllumazine synthase
MELNAKIAIIRSQFNDEITSQLLKGAYQTLLDKGISEKNVTVLDVPGAVEIPLIAKKLAQKNTFDAIIALGAVIRGETSHYDYVCEMVSRGCMDVSLAHCVPVIFGVLTTENEAQAFDRIGGRHGHKGEDAANAALAMIKIMRGMAG